MKENENLDGFLVRRITPLPLLRGTAIELLHEKSGARILHLHNDDAENLFSVTFPTPPTDDTGVPHILEHCVLAGSRKYRVKDPFFEMVKSSMATFINAMTASDHTVYPVASNVRQDFYNLAEVYWDAVFHPLLTEKTFEREGHHLELDEDGKLIVKGIVFNEMKGARSSPEGIVYDFIEKKLWPDTPYGKDSGGDPEKIPDLTWQGLVDFHRALYHPSNAFIFLYGDIATTDHLNFLRPRLAEFTKTRIRADLPPQPRWSEPHTAREVYPVSPTDALENKTFVTLNWLIGAGSDVEELFAFTALERILLGNQAAPLRKALIDSKLGEDLTHSGYWVNGVDTSFHIGLKGTQADRVDAITDLVTGTLKKIADEGIDQERFDAAIQQLAYRYLEITPSHPLNMMGSVVSMWQLGADPLALLHAQAQIERLKNRFKENPGFFGDLIRAKLLNNPHRLTLIVSPDREIQAQRDVAWGAKMKAMRLAMSPEKLAAVKWNQAELAAVLDQPNSPEAIATLPQLQVRDLPSKPRHIPTTVEAMGNGATLLVNDVFANGVNYLQLSFDLAGLSAELYPYLPLYGDCVHKIGAAGQYFAAIAERVSAQTGGIGFNASIASRVDEPGKIVKQAVFTIKFLDDRAPAALDLLGDVMWGMDPRDAARLKDVLLQGRSHQRMRPASDGLGIAVRHASRGANLEGFLQDTLGGLPQVELFEELATTDLDALIARIEAVRGYFSKSANLTASFTGSSKVLEMVRRRVAAWTEKKRGAVPPAVLPNFQTWNRPPREGLAAPMNVAYCVTAMPAPHVSDPIAPTLAVGARLLGLGYVLEEVRFKGTAYGGGCSYSGGGQRFTFHSYRDPWIFRTLDVYNGSLDYVRKAEWTQGDVDRAIIGTAKEGERPIRPPTAGGLALWRHLIGDSRERREARHAAMLAISLEQVRRALTEQFERNAANAAVCVVSSREKLQEANQQRPAEALEIRNILP